MCAKGKIGVDSAVFEETAGNERAHAEELFEQIVGTRENACRTSIEAVQKNARQFEDGSGGGRI